VGEDAAYAEVDHTFRDVAWGPLEYRIHSFVYGVRAAQGKGCGSSALLFAEGAHVWRAGHLRLLPASPAVPPTRSDPLSRCRTRPGCPM
jgi:hypothetical protein